MGFGLNLSVISSLEHTVPGFQMTPRPVEEWERKALEISLGEDACLCQVTRCGRENSKRPGRGIRGTCYLIATHAPSLSCLSCLHPEGTGDGWPAVFCQHRDDLGPVRAMCSPLGLKFVKTKQTFDALLRN